MRSALIVTVGIVVFLILGVPAAATIDCDNPNGYPICVTLASSGNIVAPPAGDRYCPPQSCTFGTCGMSCITCGVDPCPASCVFGKICDTDDTIDETFAIDTDEQCLAELPYPFCDSTHHRMEYQWKFTNVKAGDQCLDFAGYRDGEDFEFLTCNCIREDADTCNNFNEKNCDTGEFFTDITGADIDSASQIHPDPAIAITTTQDQREVHILLKDSGGGDTSPSEVYVDLLKIITILDSEALDTDQDTIGNICDDDDDNDSVLDVTDNCRLVSNASQTNSDSDSLGDACDNCDNDTNETPTNSDSDSHGDACDNCPNDDNENQSNIDSDSHGDACDNCLDDTNENQLDTDSDDIGDVCDVDDDNDGTNDSSDNCPLDFNPSQVDTDSDGVGDKCDDCTDSDGDGAGDPFFLLNQCPTDNCPTTPNAGQENDDGDSLGNACDNCDNDTNENQTNSDSDSHGDACDNCDNDDNENQTNSDSDSHGDACDNCDNDDNESQTDSDSDGLGDACDPCTENGTCSAPEDCDTCENDCPEVHTGPPGGRHCCGDGVTEGPEVGDPNLCDGND